MRQVPEKDWYAERDRALVAEARVVELEAKLVQVKAKLAQVTSLLTSIQESVDRLDLENGRLLNCIRCCGDACEIAYRSGLRSTASVDTPCSSCGASRPIVVNGLCAECNVKCGDVGWSRPSEPLPVGFDEPCVFCGTLIGVWRTKDGIARCDDVRCGNAYREQ